MDGRSANRGFVIQIGSISAVVLGLYIYLTWRDTPEISLLDFIKGVVKFFLLLWGRIPQSVWLVFFDFVLLLFFILAGLAFFVQFSLPVRNLVQRIRAFSSLSRHAVRMHGPAIKVDNGIIPKAYPRHQIVSKSGVIVFDTASAGLLRTAVGYTRSVGPGLVFTNKFEYLADAVDLHRQIWPQPPFGPRGDEDPFKPWDEKNEEREAFDQRAKRRYETSGQTRDSIEVVANIFVSCQINPDLKSPDEHDKKRKRGLRARPGGSMQPETTTGFGYSPEAVRLAITGQEIDPRVKADQVDRKHLPWFQLPAYLAVDLWREYLRKFTFEELFTELSPYGGQTALQVIQKKVRERLTQPIVDVIDSMGQPVQEQAESYEYQVLQERGTRVLYVIVRNLRFEAQVDQQLEDKWFAFWRWRAEDEREYVDRLRSYRMHEGEQQALREFAFSAARRFTEDFMGLPRPADLQDRHDQMRDSLELMLRGTLRQCVNDTQLHQRLVGEEAQLVAIIDWLRRQGN